MKLIWIIISLVALNSTTEKGPNHIAYIFLNESCVISQYYTLTLNELSDEYNTDQIQFVGVFPNTISTIKSIDSFRQKYNIDFTMIPDSDQEISVKYGAQVTPEVIVVNSANDEIIYKGRIDNTYYSLGEKRTVTTSFELKDVLKSLSTGTEVTTENQPAIGCLIQF